MTTYNIDTLQPRYARWRALNRQTPVYRDMPPLPHAVPPKDSPLAFEFLAERDGRSPLEISRLEDDRPVGGYRGRSIEWLYHLAGAVAPAQLVGLRAELYPDNDAMPSLPAVHFRELAAAMWESVTFPGLFDNYPAEFSLTVSVELEEAGIAVRPDVRLLRVGPEVIMNPLEGLPFADEAMEQARSRWGRFCQESMRWLLDSGISYLELRGCTATVPRR